MARLTGDDGAAYRRGLLEAYQGEVYGEALFRAAARASHTEERRRTWHILERLEREMKEHLAPLVVRHGGDLTPDEARIRSGERHGAALGARSWRTAMEAFAPVIEPALARFRALREAGPAEDADVLDLLVRHEECLGEFARLELDGRSERSLDPVLALLES